MEANIISQNNDEIVIQFKIKLESSMLNTEEIIQSRLNDVGCLATEIALARYDTDGGAIEVNGEKYTSKGQIEKNYQTPYGEIALSRHVYQSSQGGKTYCPLENGAKIITGSTPKFAKMVSFKYSSNGARIVQKDLEENHGRYVSRSYIKDISDTVGQLALDKMQSWNYAPPVPPEAVKVISLGLDGTCVYMSEDGWRQAMVGTISFYDGETNRLHTIYLSSPPEYGKAGFIASFEKEIEHIRRIYPGVDYVGIADGAADNWKFLLKHTAFQILDFYHASEYVTKVGDILFRDKEKRRKWLTDSCHKLKHEEKGAIELLNEFIGYRAKKMNKQKLEKLESAITYFSNHHTKMNYNEYMMKNYPIGSGVTESACKVIVKQRLCNSGMKWKQQGAEAVLCLRALCYSDSRWGQMWNKINKYGI